VSSALVLVHDEVPGRGAREVGTVLPALVELGFEVVVATFVGGGPPVPGPDEVDLVVVLGSADAAYDDSVPWLPAERAYVTRAVELGTPVFGICFGAQLLARVLGATVGRAPRAERGFVTLGSADPDLVPPGTWLEFHDDAFTLPPGAVLIAANEVGVQAFRHGHHLGVQFHPEITAVAIDAWKDSWLAAGELDAVTATVNLPALTAQIVARSDETVAACRDLVRRFCARLP
jgi:GMP synthase (glutamine-hydrolysing)